MIYPRIVLGAVVALAALASQADAGLLFRKAQPEPQPEVIQPIPMPAYAAKPTDPGCCQPMIKCCPKACVKYRHRGIKIRCCDCPYETMLCAIDPCTCCPVNIPVCLPGCCKGQPCVSGRPTILGNGLVKYEWCCGVSVTVRFQRDGDVAVTYWRA